MLVLGIESSCDDTAAAVYSTSDRAVLANVVSSQFSVHTPFGGIVPELASRCHIEAIWPVVREALGKASTELADIDLIAVTRGPGLVGSLLVGLTFAKALALVTAIPCTGVDHMHGHLLSVLLNKERPHFPYTALVVSGGHTSLYSVSDENTYTCVGQTRDDAAGEAFDKVAKLLALDYPGGPAISRWAEQGAPEAISFPRAWLGKENLDFSFSGLKTSVAAYVHDLGHHPIPVADISASFQEAVVEVLVTKTIKAAQKNNHTRVILGGGVAANQRLRCSMAEQCARANLQLFMPPPVYCTDNGAMIAVAGYHNYLKGETLLPDSDAYSRSPSR